MDVSPPALKGLQVDGTLVLEDRDLTISADWITVSGRLEIGSEAKPFTHHLAITLTGSDETENIGRMGTKMIGVASGGTLEIHGQPRTSWTRLSATALKGATQIQLESPPDWKVGDRIVVASTDFDPLQAEEAIVRSVSGATVAIEQPLKFSHWGTIQTIAGTQLDERAEVGLLTRNIRIQGDDASTTTGFGGHIIMLAGSIGHIEGAELYHMGQRAKVARYPIHWHMAKHVPGQYARNNSIWKTFSRCVTIHGTHEATVQNNVCYDHLGHGYFLEDGVETKNLVTNNLGLVTRIPAVADRLLGSDSRASTFWITNPDNTYRGNVAAGSLGIGFWVALPEHPTGFSTDATIWPRQTPLGVFSDNVAHSNRDFALNVDQGPMPDGNVETTTYSPRAVPGTSSAAVVADFHNFTAYKHNGRAVWLRTNNALLTGAILSDNLIGATFASSETFLRDAIIIGESANNATLPGNSTFPIRGYEFYDGRVGAERVRFVNFTPNSRRQASALGFNRSNGFNVSTGNFASAIELIQSNSVFLEDPKADKDGDKNAVILDKDGSITGVGGSYVVANMPLLFSSSCTRRPEWNSYVCPNRFVGLSVSSSSGESLAPFTAVRDDGAAGTLVGTPGNPKNANMSVIPGRSYKLDFTPGTPAKVQFSARLALAGDRITLTLPYPDVPLLIIRDGSTSTPLTAAASVTEMQAADGAKYFYDKTTGNVSVVLFVRAGRDNTTVLIGPR
jgi:cell migration-inducing and hyaluronan-binding protein